MSNSLTFPNRLILSLGAAAGVAIATGIGFWYHKVYKRNLIPKKWRRVGTLEEFYFFPVKSCGPINVKDGDEVDCELLGLLWHGITDRSLMLVDANNEMITGRTYPKLVLIKSEITENGKLYLTAPELEPLEINFANFSQLDDKRDSVSTSVFGVKLKVLLCGEAYDKWFSQAVLGKANGLKLVYYNHSAPVRDVFKMMAHEPYISRKDTGTFGDATSYMLMNLASIKDLNTRLVNPVSAIQFRGNFYLKMDNEEAYAEDHWSWVKIGEDAIFRNVAPCTRCIMPNINYAKGERDPEGEPLRTLKTYRTIAKYKSPQLGVHMGLRQRGTIKLHDVIYVEDI